MKVVIALVLAVLMNVVLYLYLQAQPAPPVAEAPLNTSQMIVVHTP